VLEKRITGKKRNTIVLSQLSGVFDVCVERYFENLFFDLGHIVKYPPIMIISFS